MDRRGIPADVLRRCSRSACSLLVSPGAAGTAPGLAPEDAGCGYEAGVPGTSSPPRGSFLRPGLVLNPLRCPHVPRRESPPAGQKTPDSGHASQEPKSENSSTQSSPEMPTTKNRLGLGAC